MTENELVTPRELADFLRTPLSAVYRLTHTKNIPFLKLGHRCLRFRKSDIELWLSEKTQLVEEGEE